jgi:hypothetical protein
MLPTGTPARMYCHQVAAGAGLAGTVVHVKLGGSDTAPSVQRDSATPMLLPGLVGHAPLWLRACHEVETAYQAGEWLALQGEAGVGKLALLRAVQLRRPPGRRFTMLDAADASTDPAWMTPVRSVLLDAADSVVIGHVDGLDAAQCRALASALQDASSTRRDRPLWVAITLGQANSGPASGGKEFDQVLRHFPSTVEVPPLRLHLEDLEQLVSFFLAKLGHGSRITCSPETMRLLMRSSWPGNVEQLHQLLHQVVQHRRSGLIQPCDLPPEAKTVSRRRLSALESMERDAIVKALSDAQGNKLEAAHALGMSRATIYRKIHEYGVIAPAAEPA